MTGTSPTIFVVDDDISVRESLELLIRKHGWHPETFISAHEFLARPRLFAPSCLVLDFSLPGLTGLELQKHVAIELPHLPIIFLTGFGDIPMTVQAMKPGAVEFLTKPFSNESLLSAIRNAIEHSRVKLDSEMEIRALKARFAALTMRERQVMTLVVSGMLNKQIGFELGITEITVKFHRGHIMQKMKADSIAELVNMATRLRLKESFAARPPEVR
jgi:FixJ family two-component response regulator